MQWLGLDYDEEIVFQSANADKHRAAAYKLVDEGKAYRDFTPKADRDDANVKQDIAERARAQSADRHQIIATILSVTCRRRILTSALRGRTICCTPEGCACGKDSHFADLVFGRTGA